MITNDFIVVVARTQVVNAYFAAGNSTWIEDSEFMIDLITGWTNSCNGLEALNGGRESPALVGIINPKTVDLAGSAVGVIAPINITFNVKNFKVRQGSFSLTSSRYSSSMNLVHF